MINADTSSKSESPEMINLEDDDLEVSFKIESPVKRTTRNGNPIVDSVNNDEDILAIFDVVI